MSGTSPTRLPVLSIALLSACALAYEVLLMRLFSIIQWHHFAYMVISLALLGYGASGTFLALARRRLLARFPLAFIANVWLFAAASLGCFLLAQRIAPHIEQMLWDPWQLARLSLVYLLLALPFFCAANAIGLALSRHGEGIARLYAADLLGAGLGSLAIVGLLFLLFPATLVQVIATLGFVTAAVAAWEVGCLQRRTAATLLLAAAIPWLLPASWLALAISPYKGLSQQMQIQGSRIVAERSSPLGLLSVVESPQVPLRHAPGLSLAASAEPPEQLAVFTDGDAMTVLTRQADDPAQLSYLDQMTSAAPYHLASARHVLILGAGGGSDVLQARHHRAARIDAVEINPQMIELVDSDFAAYTGALYRQPGIAIHAAEARGFVAASREHYDLIQLSLLDSFSAAAAGLHALNESQLYTVEAMQDYLRRLQPEGMIAITRWVTLPPRDTLKLFATAVAALRASGIEDPQARLALIRGWQTSTLLIRNGPFRPHELEALQRFCRERAFDVDYFPGISAEQTNRYNVLNEPIFFTAAQQLLGAQSREFLRDYKFDIAPATDDRPYFFHFFKWRLLPEIVRLRAQGGALLIEWGYLVLVATLLQAALLSVALIVLPLLLSRRTALRAPGSPVRAMSGYFAALGLGFLFIEIAFIQKFMLFLHHPLYATPVVLCAFLVFAGLGSRHAQRYRHSAAAMKAGIRRAVAGIVIAGALYLLALGALFDLLAPLPTLARIAASILLIAPLAFCMGMPFPTGLALLAERDAALIPWAWGINGCASVISAILATLLAIHLGFSSVVLSALLLYLAAALIAARL